jgi:DNA modification methylase
MQRTKNHGLLHKNFTQRSEVTRQGMADYLIVFRKWEGVEGTESPITVKHALKAPSNGKGHVYRGENAPSTFDSDRDYSIQVWQRYASPVWFDINQTRVLNYQLAKDSNDEKHICPLQLDVIERSIDLWTNPGELVMDPFNGIGSSGVCALRMGRKYVGCELKPGYFNVSVRNLKAAEDEVKIPTLFDMNAIV